MLRNRLTAGLPGFERLTTISWTLTLLLALALSCATSAQDSGRRAISTDRAPAAIGPYSQAIVAGNLVFVAGQLGMDSTGGTLVSGGIREQTDRALRNIAAILEAAGSDLDHVVSCSVFVSDLDNFMAMNEVYAGYFKTPAPARATVQVSRLPKDALVEISCIAVLP